MQVNNKFISNKARINKIKLKNNIKNNFIKEKK